METTIQTILSDERRRLIIEFNRWQVKYPHVVRLTKYISEYPTDEIRDFIVEILNYDYKTRFNICNE